MKLDDKNIFNIDTYGNGLRVKNNIFKMDEFRV